MTIGRLSLAVAVALAQAPFSHIVAFQDAWPPAGVQRPGPNVTPPRLLSEVRPNYTADAMRARIQGGVLLEAVVELDGTVGAVRVVRSLDARFGIDEEAVKTVKKWRFEPGRKDGVPARVAVTIDMTFSLRGLPPPDPTPLAWPAAFEQSDPELQGTWTEESIQYKDLRIRFSRPAGWTIVPGRSLSQMMLMVSEDGRLSFAVMEPGLAGFPTEPQTPARLHHFAEFMKGRAPASATAPAVDIGQARVDDRLWIWLEARFRSLDLANAPADVSARIRGRVGGVTMWTLTTAIPPESMAVSCTAAHPPDASESAVVGQRREAGRMCGAIMQRFSVERR